MKMRTLRRLVAVPVLVLAVQALAPTAGATHAWTDEASGLVYHWARASAFELQLLDSVSSAWDANLTTASVDWSQSAVVDTRIVPGNPRAAKTCAATAGKVQVCNYTYGRNGWLGIAEIWTDSAAHILQGRVKLNDTYFNSAQYRDPAWKNLVMCQEVGHTLGLDHQDEAFDNANLGTCMDYTNYPGANQHPNADDYTELSNIYAHTSDATTSVATAQAAGRLAADVHSQGDWGRAIRNDANGRPVLFARVLSGDVTHFTWVTWAE